MDINGREKAKRFWIVASLLGICMFVTAIFCFFHTEKSRPDEFDVILMDIMMPVMNGYEAAKMIRALDRDDAKTVPIIAMTANAFTEDRLKSKESGMNEHIAKPIDAKLLVKVISELVKNKEEDS